MKGFKMKFILGLLLVVAITSMQSMVYATTQQQKAVAEISQAGDIPHGVTAVSETVASPDLVTLTRGQMLAYADVNAMYAQNTPPAPVADGTGTIVSDATPPDEIATAPAAPTDTSSILTAFRSNWAEILLGLLAFIKILVRLTPSLRDDSVFGRIDSLISWFVPNLQSRKNG
jgi:hypothetical protein